MKSTALFSKIESMCRKKRYEKEIDKLTHRCYNIENLYIDR